MRDHVDEFVEDQRGNRQRRVGVGDLLAEVLPGELVPIEARDVSPEEHVGVEAAYRKAS